MDDRKPLPVVLAAAAPGSLSDLLARGEKLVFQRRWQIIFVLVLRAALHRRDQIHPFNQGLANGLLRVCS